MKKAICLGLMITIFAVSNSCNRDNNKGNLVPTRNIEDGNYDTSFDWSTTKVIEINISCEIDIIISITSVNDQIRYHRGRHFGGNTMYIVKLCIPNVVKQLKVNNDTIDIDSKILHHSII